jgi:regulatory protein
MDDPDTHSRALGSSTGRRRRRGRANGVGETGAGGSGAVKPGAGGSGAAEPDTRELGPAVAPESLARQIALRQLTAGPRTRSQLAEAMTAKGIPAETVATVLDRFGDVGLVDDQSFAHSWVESRHAGRGLGRQVLRQELRNKGVDDELIAEAVGAVSDDDEMAAARALVRRKLRSMSALDHQTRTRRLLGQLARRGCGSGVAFAAIRAELSPDLDDPASEST